MAETVEERIKEIEEEIRTTPYHKATEHHIGKLRAKIARLKDQALAPKGGSGGGGGGFSVAKEGDATVVFVGFPSVGKSTLLNKLTHASSKVGAYDFTTVNVIPGMMNYNGAQIQLLDLPGIVSLAATGKGMGRKILSATRAANLLLIMVDANKLNQEEIIKKELQDAGIRINQKRPNVIIKKTSQGGLLVNTPNLSKVKKEDVVSLAEEFGLKNAEILVKEDLSYDSLVDAFAQNRVYVPAIFAVNKVDLAKNLNNLKRSLPDHLFISAEKDLGFEELRETIWEKLRLMRIFLKDPSGKIDFDNPLVIKRGLTVFEAACEVSQELALEVKGAQIYGPGAAYDGQKVGLSFVLKEGGVVNFTK